jgi:hypothetical protein
MAVTPNSAYLFVAAVTALLQEPRVNSRHRKNYRFGLLIAHMMKDIHTRLVKEKRKLPPRRFACYARYHLPEEADWTKQCDQLLILHLTTPSAMWKKDKMAAYKAVREELAASFPYVNVLGGNHLVAIAGMLGFLPLWLTSQIEIQKGLSIRWLLEKFYPKLKEKTKKKDEPKIDLDEIITNIVAALKTRNGTEFTKRQGKNIVCKVF